MLKDLEIAEDSFQEYFVKKNSKNTIFLMKSLKSIVLTPKKRELLGACTIK